MQGMLPHPLVKSFGAKLNRLGQICLDLDEIQEKLKQNSVKIDYIWAKLKSCKPEIIQFPTAMNISICKILTLNIKLPQILYLACSVG